MNSKKSSSRSVESNRGAIKKSMINKSMIKKSAALKKLSTKSTVSKPKSKSTAKSKTHATLQATAIQPSAQRKKIEVALNELIEKFSPAQVRLVRAVRKWLQNRLPTAHEIVYEYRDCFLVSYSPSTHGYQGVLAIRGSAEAVQLYFNRGKELSDPGKLLKGSANLVRYIDIDSAATFKRPEVVQLIEQAVARSPVPFVTDGPGSMIFSPSTAKKKK